jgi:hypothetical protein
VRHLIAGLDLSRDKLTGHITGRKGRTQFLAFCRYPRSLHPPQVRIAIVCDNFSPHLSTGTDHPTHREQARMIRRYIAYRNRHVTDPTLREVIKRASPIKRAKVA